MNWFIFAIILIITLFVGIFGFCQIVGTIKYFRNFNTVSALATIILWTLILTIGLIIVLAFFEKYYMALVIGYTISFLLSFKTQPDQPNSQIKPFEKPTPSFDTSIMSAEDKENYLYLQQSIDTLQKTYDDAVKNLDGMTIEEVETLHKYKQISDEQYAEQKNAVESLTFMKDTLPISIQEMKNKQLDLINKYNN